MTAAPANPRGCPFCKGVVPADLVLHGGNCPHCMLEIPGEEAPTDPGLQARLRQQAEDAVRAKKKRQVNRLAGLVGLFLAVAAVGGGMRYQAARDAELVYELDDYYVIPDSALQSAPVPVAAVVAADPTPGTTSHRPKNPSATAQGSGSLPADGAADDVVASAPQTFVPAARPKTDIKLAPTANAADGVRTTSMDFAIGRVSSAAVLQNDDEIKAMARKVIDAYSPQLTTCYQTRLAQNDTLKGAWKVAFTISQDGAATKVKVTAVNAPDAELEACMTRNIQSWKFQKIYDDFPLSKTYRFGAEGW